MSLLTATVVFQATRNGSEFFSAGDIVIYPEVTYNEGFGYDSATGKFTAPVSGLYAFAQQACLSTNDFEYTHFVYNNQSLLASFNSAPSHYGACTSAQIFLTMASGDQLWVGTTSTSNIWSHDTYAQTSFAGAFIHA